MAESAKSKASREKRERMIKLKMRFENRISIVKYGKDAFDQGDYANALRRFVEYLNILSEVRGITDFYSLRTNLFDPKKDLTEMLMLSHIFFEMARLYDAVPRFHEDAKKCLEQFVHFTANQPYQVVNSEMVRKHLKKSKFKHPDNFRNAYQQIYVQSKKCYIVTFCYGETHSITADCREFKDVLLNYRWGQELVRIYYTLSHKTITKWEQNPCAHLVAQLIFKPALIVFSKTILPLIIRKC